MSLTASASNGTDLYPLIEVSAGEIVEMMKKGGDALGKPVYFADAMGPNGLLVFPPAAPGWKISTWRHISLNPGAGDGRSSGKIGQNPYDTPYTE